MTPEEIAHWPGKTFDQGTHPALWHMLDVGAVAVELSRLLPITTNPAWEKAFVFLIALHDLGKISDAFRRMILGEPYPPGPRHWQHSYRLFYEHDALLTGLLGGSKGARLKLYAAVAGHHGGPPENLADRAWEDQQRQIGKEAFAASAQVIEAVCGLIEGASLDGLCESDAKKLNWALCGQTVISDWIGSNTAWFGLKPPDIPIAQYWQSAREQAISAIGEAGLFHARPRADGAGGILGPFRPRPMQEAAGEIALPEGPALAMIEDATGAGKTEAALILAARMMAAGKGRGVFFALPTMATSNAMLPRMAEAAPTLFEGRPSLGLTHGKAQMNDYFREIRGGGSERKRDDVNCSEWLADDRRRVLLADLGVGTIDQALLGVLPTRFSALRLRALAPHILIVDEAHSYDPYMERELCGLLKFHAMLGGSAIVMTATLPVEMRESFARAFREGLGGHAPKPLYPGHQPDPVIAQAEYPQLTMISQSDVDSCQPAPVPATCRDLGVRRLESAAQAIETLAQGAGQGAACVWVRNAVGDAIEAVRALRAAGIEADLLHARFTVADRLEKEQALQARFGREGQGRAGADGKGRVLVATQVVEASLDLDFDLMVSDLAPIGSLLQRAGRLWRHMDKRPAESRPVPGPVLHVLAPDPAEVAGPRWLHEVLAAGAWVYPPDHQWRTARVIFEAAAIRMPDDLRGVIEAVHGSDPLPLPEPLEDAGWETEGRAQSEAQQAMRNIPDPFAGYDQPHMQRVFDDEQYPTRLGRPQITLRLACRQGERLAPYAGTGRFGWQMSEVEISRARYEKLEGVDQEAPAIAALKQDWPEWKRAQVILAPVGEGGAICEGLRYCRDEGIVFG